MNTSRHLNACRGPRARLRQSGAALLIALLTVTLIATFAATALWQQWRATEVEAAERARMQSAWVLVGALDWSRLILQTDAAGGPATASVDHLAEPWAIPLAEARLSSFLAADKNVASDAMEGLPEAFLSGQIIDAQSKLNARNLVGGARPNGAAVAAFQKLFGLLGLPVEQVTLLAEGLRRATPRSATVPTGTGTGMGTTGTTATPNTGQSSGTQAAATDSSADAAFTGGATEGSVDEGAALAPQRVQELVWLGLPASTVAAIEPYVTLLPEATKVNINTASAEVLFASAPDLDLANARRVKAQRQLRAFPNLQAANEALANSGSPFTEGVHAVSTSYFEVTGRLRLDKYWVEERSLLRRQQTRLSVLWRQRGAGTTQTPVRP